MNYFDSNRTMAGIELCKFTLGYFKINSKFPKEVNGTATKCSVYTVHES
jgi:hypothetical protein